MGAHPRRRGFRVSLDDRFRDCAMLLNGDFEHGLRQNVADLRHDERQLQPQRQIAELQIVGERHHGVVEGGVFLEIFARLPGRVDIDRLDCGDKARPPAGRISRGGEPGGERLHLDPDLEQFANLAPREAPDQRAAVRPMLDQPLGAEAPQRLAHRPAAHRKPRRELPLDQSLAGRDPPRQNVVAQPRDDERDRRSMDRRVRSPMRLVARLAGRAVHAWFPHPSDGV